MNRHGQRNTLHPYAIHIYNTDRQTDNRTRTTDILATDCEYDIIIRLVPEHVMLSMSCLFLDMGILQ